MGGYLSSPVWLHLSPRIDQFTLLRVCGQTPNTVEICVISCEKYGNLTSWLMNIQLCYFLEVKIVDISTTSSSDAPIP